MFLNVHQVCRGAALPICKIRRQRRGARLFQSDCAD
jgi:hypothetical protein